VVLEFFRRAGVDLKPEYEVHNVVHAFSGGVPTVDLILAYHKANKSRS
jgi:LysR family hca operon transcriptional activator